MAPRYLDCVSGCNNSDLRLPPTANHKLIVLTMRMQAFRRAVAKSRLDVKSGVLRGQDMPDEQYLGQRLDGGQPLSLVDEVQEGEKEERVDGE